MSDRKKLDKQLKDFEYDNLPDAYSNKLLMSFDALQFTEGELTTDNISYLDKFNNLLELTLNCISIIPSLKK